MVTRVVGAIRRLLEEERIEITLQPGFRERIWLTKCSHVATLVS